ncbi:l-asparaginase [Trichonephila inaurata madagascariensis]|uniref:asparaginase n=1 Tax=Trichonephila inaurata madagascariensis TaxID=2747483 RepID=A0A8X6XYE5_9ARAC|nr:l-asparaginase [Trichonephila inaurata madagascariensis]
MSDICAELLYEIEMLELTERTRVRILLSAKFKGRPSVRAFLSPPIEGVVLQTYGAGNGPSQRKDLFDELKRANRRGVIIVNCTQCSLGQVDPSYETGRALVDVGVVPGSDMTLEAALTKLSYVLSKKEWTIQTKRNMMKANLRGELTVYKEMKFEDLDVITAIIRTLRLSSSEVSRLY